MNAFTIIKTGQEDKSVMQKEDLISGEFRNYSEFILDYPESPGSGQMPPFRAKATPEWARLGFRGYFPQVWHGQDTLHIARFLTIPTGER
jgi:hypothetical protein